MTAFRGAHRRPHRQQERSGRDHRPREYIISSICCSKTTQLGTLDYEKEKPHLDRITALYEQHFHETDPEKRKAIYEEINKEAQLAAQYEIPNEMDKLYKAMGEVGLDAHTWHEETVYQVNLPSNRLEQWAVIEFSMFRASDLPPVRAGTGNRLRGKKPDARQQGRSTHRRRREQVALQETSRRPADNHR